MKKSFTLILFLFVTIIVYGQKTETRSLKSFNKIKVSGGISVELLEGEPAAEIEIIKGEMDELKTEVKGDVLHIKFEKSGIFNWNSGNRKAYIKLRGGSDINEVDASAGSYVGSEETIKSQSLEFDVSSGASIEIEIESEDVNSSASSGGSMKLYGSTKNLLAQASSGGTLNAKSLKSEEADVSASSGGSVSVWATDEISAHASSGGSVSYKGNPKKKNLESGKYSGGNIRHID